MVVDPFAGSALLLKTAYMNGRNAVGYEIDEELIPIITGNGCNVVKDGKVIAKGKQGIIL